jgi:hypothetical protein
MLRRAIPVQRGQLVVPPESFRIALWVCVIAIEIHLGQKKDRIGIVELCSFLQKPHCLSYWSWQLLVFLYLNS